MDYNDDPVAKEAITWVKENQKKLIEKFCSLVVFPRSLKPFTFFMAGSPGAGKTEFSKSIIVELKKKDALSAIVRIDADDIRCEIPFYNGKNSDQVQAAAAIGVEKIFDHVQKHGQDAILDSTFADRDISRRNVERAINRERDIGVFYLYQDPILAWKFAKIREKKDGRHVPKDFFIQSFFSAKNNANLIKKEFGSKVQLNLVIKNVNQTVEKTYFNIENIDSYLKINYTIGQLKNILLNELDKIV